MKQHALKKKIRTEHEIFILNRSYARIVFY